MKRVGIAVTFKVFKITESPTFILMSIKQLIFGLLEKTENKNKNFWKENTLGSKPNSQSTGSATVIVLCLDLDLEGHGEI